MSATLALSALGLLVASIGVVHAKVKISSVLVHHATHGKGLKDAKANRLMAEALSVIALTTPFDEYKRVHNIHHGKRFAGMEDEEALFLNGLGFRPGVPREQLWKIFWKTLFSPRFHFALTKARLAANFTQATAWHNAAAWGVWGAAVAAATAAGVLPGFIVGFLVPLMVGGNIGSFLELASRHRWMVTPDVEKRRQFELSHGRFTAPEPPAEGASIGAWMAWGVRVAGATVARLTVVPTDLNWHIAHHIGLKRPEGMTTPAWSDAALAHSFDIHADAALAGQSHASILAAIDAWFSALEKEPRMH